MPFKEWTPDQDWLFPPSVGDMLPHDHPARFVAEFVDGLDLGALGICAVAPVEGNPAYHPRLLLRCWVYGFMDRTRTTRRLEKACHEVIPFMWLAGQEKPDHSTFSRFYKANRKAMRKLFKATVRRAMGAGLIDFALQALDGTKVPVGSNEKAKKLEALRKLLNEIETTIEAMERESDDLAPEKAPTQRALEAKRDLKARAQEALRQLEHEADGASKGSEKTGYVTDPDARLMKTRHGWKEAYNAQALVDSKEQIIVAGDVTTDRSDQDQLIPLLEQENENTGRYPDKTAADAGYFSGGNLADAEDLTELFVPDPRLRQKNSPTRWPYHKDHFLYDEQRDVYLCPKGKELYFERFTRKAKGKPRQRQYHCADCNQCPARSECTTSTRGRSITIGPFDAKIRAHSDKMQQQSSKDLLKQRLPLVEGPFGIIKQQMDARRFLLRGLENVRAEWQLLCAAFNLRKLYKHWRTGLSAGLPMTA